MTDIVERLRNDWDCAEGDEAAAEIERLRGHIELLLEGDGKAQNEIERLRGLLLDVDDGLDDYWVTTKEGADWICRRSKALGE